jgi:ketosteroid isomerase-like protein
VNEAAELIRRVNAAVASGTADAAVQLMHPDVVWEHNLGVGSPEEGVYSGREAVLRLFERILEPWEYMRAEPDDIHDLGGGDYFVTGALHAKHLTSETVIVSHFEQRLQIRDGLLVRGRMTTGDMVAGGQSGARDG